MRCPSASQLKDRIRELEAALVDTALNLSTGSPLSDTGKHV